MVFEVFGSYAGYAVAIAIVIASVIVAKVFMKIFEKFVLHITSKTKTRLDDLILHAIKRPVYAGIVLVGVFFALDYVDFDAYAALIRHVFYILWILIGAYAIANAVGAVLAWYREDIAKKTHSKIDDTVVPIMRKLIKAFIYAIAFILVLNSFGVEITPLLAGLGVGGLAIALALQGPLSNLFAGMFLVSDKAIKTGDYIELEYIISGKQVRGYIEEVGWRSTRVKLRDGNIVIIPNSKLSESFIENYNSPNENFVIEVDVGVGYLSDLELVDKITVDVATDVQRTVQGALRDYKPDVLYQDFGDSNINFKVRLQAESAEARHLVKSEFIKRLKKRYDKEGIEISWPVRKIYYGDKGKKE
ncbi:MAG: mechanosensitive ion channel family protein [Candidatus Aenigmarchaeota archaeon]|nr:mechanosensitive ion channel family protein [Candidatus Aenigmarchaeota archaeon]